MIQAAEIRDVISVTGAQHFEPEEARLTQMLVEHAPTLRQAGALDGFNRVATIELPGAPRCERMHAITQSSVDRRPAMPAGRLRVP